LRSERASRTDLSFQPVRSARLKCTVDSNMTTIRGELCSAGARFEADFARPWSKRRWASAPWPRLPGGYSGFEVKRHIQGSNAAGEPVHHAQAELVRARLERHRRLLEEAVEKPPDAYRTIFMLRDVEEMSTADTADVLEITEENVKVRLHRARVLLRKSLYARAGIERKEAFNFHAVRCDRVVKNVFERIQKHVSKTGNAAAGMQ
jgi:RNA polymerase sigma factor (sigma-70 family)